MNKIASKSDKVDQKKLRRQIENNYKAFTANLNEYVNVYANRYALMRDGKIIEFFNSYEDAWKTGNILYKDSLFSVQKVTKTPVDLGFYSRALHTR